jgi:hypothetical protein
VSVNAAEIAPWSGAAEDLIRGALRHVYAVRIFEDPWYETPVYLPITVTSCSLTYDEFWSPYVQGSLTAVIPDAATLDKLDPRLVIRVDVDAGYVLPGGITDSHLICRCALSRRSVDYPANEMTLEFQGAEYLVEKTVADSDGGGPQGLYPQGYWDSGTTVASAMANTSDALTLGAFSWVATGADPGTDTLTGWVDPGQQWEGKEGENYLSIIRDVADRIDGWVRIDEFGVFKMTRRPSSTPPPAHRLRVGADGTIITSNDELSREGWANWAYVTYQWTTKVTSGGVTTETDKMASGFAYLEGKYDPNNVGRVAVSDLREHISSDAQAQKAAESLLKRFATKGDALSVQAVAAYWLRPTDGVYITLPVGAEKKLMVSAITFDLDAGSMSIRTRTAGSGALIRRGSPVRRRDHDA